MKNLQIRFEADTGLVPRLIRWFTKSRVNHVYVWWESDDLPGGMVIESALPGVRIIPTEGRPGIIQYKINFDLIPGIQREKKLVGQKYDFGGLVMFAIILMAKQWISHKIKFPWKNTKRQLCSEFVARCLYPHFQFENCEWVTPQQILEICENNPGKFSKVV